MAIPASPLSSAAPGAGQDLKRRCLTALERRVLWLSVWMIHHANHVRAKRDGLKVGGHQASCASMVTLMTALYFDVLRPQDRVAVKPHGSPVFHAIQYLLGRQSREQLERFRAFGGAQSYPSRTKDRDDVDISTGSVGMGVAMTSFAALAQEFLRKKQITSDREPPGRMIAVAGDAEFDEGNVFEALLEAWKHQVANVWWIIDYNRQSLDAIVADRFFNRLDTVFRTMEWRVITLKYGKRLQAAFGRRGGEALRAWIDDCPNPVYSALTYQGGAAWRTQLERDLGDTAGIRELLDEHDNAALAALMTNLAGHDIDSVLEGFGAAAEDERPACLIAYTIKGFGLPFAGHKDNHAGMMTPEQIAALRDGMGVAEGDEWEPLAGCGLPAGALDEFLAAVPFNQPAERRHRAPRVPVPEALAPAVAGRQSTQEGFGRLLADIARRHPALADRIVTTSPDVTVSTNLGGWVNRRGVFAPSRQPDAFRQERTLSAQDWTMGACRAAYGARDCREQPVHPAGRAGVDRAAVRGAAAPGRHPVRPVHQPRTRRAQLRLLPGCAVSPGRHALGVEPGAGGRRAPVGAHAVDRDRPARADDVRADLRGRARGDSALELRLHAGRRRRGGVRAALHPADSISRSASSRRRCGPASSRAATG